MVFQRTLIDQFFLCVYLVFLPPAHEPGAREMAPGQDRADTDSPRLAGDSQLASSASQCLLAEGIDTVAQWEGLSLLDLSSILDGPFVHQAVQ